MAMKPCQDNMRCGRGTVGRWRAVARGGGGGGGGAGFYEELDERRTGDDAQYAERFLSEEGGGSMKRAAWYDGPADEWSGLAKE